jgi:sec-independent protein translocase protein TatC
MKLNLLKYLIFTHVTEIFLTKINICFLVSFFLTTNISIIQVWFFLYKGLYKHENIQFITNYLMFSLFSIISLNIIFKYIIPNIWYFFLKNNLLDNFNLFFEPKFNDYFNFYFYSFIFIYFIFLYLYVLYLFIFFKVTKKKNLFFFKYRKYFYFKFLIMSILISLPEILSQILIFLFFFIFFEFFLFISIFKFKYKIN